MASRFAALSPWRNLAAKPLPSYAEVPVAASEVGRSIALVDDTHIIARGNAPGSLVVLTVGDDFSGKYGNKVEALSLPAAVADIEVSSLADGLIAVGREDGCFSLLKPRCDVSSTMQQVSQGQHPEASGVTLVRWHPYAHILLTASPSSPLVCVWKSQSAGSSQHDLSFRVEVGPKAAGKCVHDIAWSRDGTKVFVALADGVVKSYDPRRSKDTPLSFSPSPLGVPKPMRIAVTSKYLLTSTLNSSRQRELRVYACDDLSRSLQTITLDTASHPLTLAVDYDRNLVFMGSKGDVTLRWIELDDSRKFPQGAFPLPSRTAFGSSALLAPTGLDVMLAEINRLYVLTTSSEVVPIRIEIPQRQLIDYHPHLYPDTAAGVAALEEEQWLNGQDAEVKRVSMDPTRRKEWLALRHNQRGESAPVVSSTPDAKGHKLNDIDSPVKAEEITSPSPALQLAEDSSTKSTAAVRAIPSPAESKQPTSAMSKEEPEGPTSSNGNKSPPLLLSTPPHQLPAATRPAASTVASSPAPSPSKPSESSKTLTSRPLATPSSSTWSRMTLSGSTPLLPAFSSVPAFDTSTSPASRSFRVTPLHIIYPLSGAGGRLAFHEIAREGRLPEAQKISWIETGFNIADFETDIFNPRRVATVGEDGLKVWLLPDATRLKGGHAVNKPETEFEQTIVSKPEASLPLADIGRCCKVSFNPIASDLVVVAGGEGLVIIDVSAPEPTVLSSLMANVIEAEWSLDGSLLAVARSDRKLVLWDPRSNTQAEIAAHDSSRPFKMCWVDEHHLVTVGHMAGSARQIKLFKLSRSSESITIAEKGRLALDTSPAILFPYYDVDAELLYLWSKGERSISVVQVALDPPKPRFGAAAPIFKALPAFQHSTPQLGVSFLPKRYGNVRAVEVGLSYRLTRGQEIQIVSWKVERKRKEFFQDDIFPPTRDVEIPAMSAGEWWKGERPVVLSKLPYIDLQPSDMTPLSQAPPPETTVSSLAKAPTQRMLTAKEREDELMSNVFNKAKGRDGEEEEEETAARKRAPDDDDWGDD